MKLNSIFTLKCRLAQPKTPQCIVRPFQYNRESVSSSPPRISSQPGVFEPGICEAFHVSYSSIVPSPFSPISSSSSISRTCPAASNIHPLRQTRSLFPLYINDVRITSTSTSDSILLHGIPGIPVLVFFFPLLLV